MTLIAEAREFLGRLQQAGVPHMLVGAMALDTLGIPRATLDVDIQIHADDGPAPGASTFMGALIEERSRDLVFGQDVLILHLPTYAVPIELFLSSHWFTLQALERRMAVESDELGRIFIPTPEDFILLKAAFHGSPHRSKMKRAVDGMDLEHVIGKNEEGLDWDYITGQARRLGVARSIEEVRAGLHGDASD